jgi:ABC-2 type transport system permease protein
MNGRTTLAIARKDIVDAIKNRYLLLSLLMPIGLALLFRFILGWSGTSTLGKIKILVYDPGGSRLAAQLQTVPGVNLVEVTSADQLTEVVAQTAAGSLNIPEGFDGNVDLGKQPQLTVYLNAQRGANELAAFRQIIIQQVWAMRDQSSPAKIVWTEAAVPGKAPVQATFRTDLYLLLIFLIMSLTMTGTLVVPLLLVEEKEKHTMDFLLVSPVTPAEIVAGKALTGLVYCGIGAGVLTTLNNGWSGDWPATLLALLVGALFVVAVGLLLGTVLNTTMQVNGWSTIVSLTLLVPSWMGVLPLPPFLDALMHFIPTYYLADILPHSMGNDLTLARGALDLGVLTGCMLLAFGIVIWILRKQEA